MGFSLEEHGIRRALVALRRPGAALAFVVCLCGPTHAQSTTPEFARTGREARETLPGASFDRSLRRSLAAPAAGGRWEGLPHFGRSLFDGGPGSFLPSEHGPVGPNYVLGPGDQLAVFISGFSDTSYALALDREGRVFLPHVGSTFLQGLSFAAAERLIETRIASVLRNAKVQVSMGRMRTIDVFVLGEAHAPGKRTLSGLATAFHALVAAGGPGPLGSMRDIRVLRANREVARFDLYPFLLTGDQSNDVRLESGDVVFVGPSRPRAGIQGAVARPGVYEMDSPCTLRRLLAFAGGVTPFADLSRIQIERVDANGGFRLQDLPLDHGHGVDPDSLLLSDYDLVTVLPLNERQRNLVTLDGYVRHPGAYEHVPGMRLSQLVTGERLLPEAALEQAEFRRVNPTTFAVEVRAFSPREVLAGRLDWELQPLDAVTIFSAARLPQSVTLDGEVARSGSYTIVPGERLSSVLRRAGGLTAAACLRAAVFTRVRAASAERTVERDFLLREQIELARQRVRFEERGDTLGAQGLIRAQAALLSVLDRGTRPGRVVLDVEEGARWEDTPRDPVLEDGDQLYVPQRSATVAVVGSVKSPGTLLLRPGAAAGDYVRLSGGATRDADMGRSYVLRANGAAVRYGAGTSIESGDAVVVVPREAGENALARGASHGFRWMLDTSVAAALLLLAVQR